MEIIIGLSLGDLNIRKQAVNAQFRFEQGAINKDYLLHLYDLFKDYCSSDPKIRGHSLKPTNKVYSSIRFESYSSPSALF